MAPPPKKMHHLESINAIPSQYPEFRNVLWTGESSQLVLMTVPVGGEIGEEVRELRHPHSTLGADQKIPPFALLALLTDSIRSLT